MYVRQTAASFLFIICCAGSAHAVFLSFDEFSSPTTFTNGQSFAVADEFGPDSVGFLSVPLIGTNGLPQSTPVAIGLPGDVGFSLGRPLGSTGNVIYPRGVLADFAGSVGRRSSVSIQFYNSFGTVNLGVNGSDPLVARAPGASAFQAFDGASIGAVMISVTDFGTGTGRIDLSGPIDTVSFGGQEAIFDSIRTTAAPPIGDYDGNGAVGPEDYDVWRTQYGSIGTHSADGNADGRVDAADFTVWAERSVSVDAAASPEPGSLAVLVVGWTLLLAGHVRQLRCGY